MLDRERILSIFSSHQNEFVKFHIKSLFIFGSVARNEASSKSDLDMLVSFEGTPTFDLYMDLKFFLEELIGCNVDLITESGLRKELKDYVERDKIRVA